MTWSKTFFEVFCEELERDKQKDETTLKWKLIFFLPLFFFLLFSYIHVSLFFFFRCRVSPTVNSSFFLCLFLGTSSNRFLFSGFSRGQSTNKIVMRFLSFFWRPFHVPICAGMGKAVYSLHHRNVCLLGDLSTCLIFPLGRFYFPAVSYHVGFLASRHSAFK